MATYETASNCLVFPHHQHTRLRVSVGSVDAAGVHLYSHNSTIATDTISLEGSLRVAQQEVVEQEIFSLLVKEAGNLPTASARVSERLIVIDAAQGMELKFELVSRWPSSRALL
jgi:mediator of RNA polymerase II transcription subunit 17